MYNLPEHYQRRENPEFFDDTPFKDEWQDEVYKLASSLEFDVDNPCIVDYGCGSGFKLLKYFAQHAPVGIDIPKTVDWLRATYPHGTWRKEREFAPYGPDLLICSDVIEHVIDPIELLRTLHAFCPHKLVISTPARKPNDFGPPANPHHAQEWTSAEFAALVGQFFDIESVHILPARVGGNELTTAVVAVG